MNKARTQTLEDIDLPDRLRSVRSERLTMTYDHFGHASTSFGKFRPSRVADVVDVAALGHPAVHLSKLHLKEGLGHVKAMAA